MATALTFIPRNAGPALAAAERIQVVLKNCQKQRLGMLGSYVFPEPTRVPADLVMLLRIHASAERLREQVAARASGKEVLEATEGYFRALLDWQKKNGFFRAYGAGTKVVFNNFIYDPSNSH